MKRKSRSIIINKCRHNRSLNHLLHRSLLSLVITAAWIGVLLTPRVTLAEDDLDKIVLPRPVQVPEFTLTDYYRKPFTQNRLKGKWSFVFFGYTHCPDVCPVTLTEMDKIIDVLPPKPGPDNNYQYVFISVDPKRDTPAVLNDYVHYFNDNIIGATGSDQELKKLTKAVKIRYSRGEGTDTEYTVNHSSAMLLFDPEGRYYARFRAPQYVDRIYENFRQIRRQYESKHH
jgi:protein SCO1/2